MLLGPLHRLAEDSQREDGLWIRSFSSGRQEVWGLCEGQSLCDIDSYIWFWVDTVYPKKYAHGFCFAVLCCGYTLTDFPISIRLTSLALWQSNDCPSASKATLMNMDKYFMWIHYERLHNHNKAKHNKTVCIFFGIYCTCNLFCMSFRASSLALALALAQSQDCL